MAKILVIEDDDQGREMLRQMLETEGYEVFDASDGEAGARMYKEILPDLVITDIIMPYKGGLETIMKLKREYSDAKIFAVTGGGRVVKADFLSIAKSVGAIRTFKKPLDRGEIIAAVAEVLGDAPQKKTDAAIAE